MFHPNNLILMVLACSSVFVNAQTAASIPRTAAPVATPHHIKTLVAATESFARHKPILAVLEYGLFIAEKTRDHESIQDAIRNNPVRFPRGIELQDMSMHIGIRPEEYATILTRILEAKDRLDENERDRRLALANFQNSAGYSAKSIPPRELIVLGKEHDAVINGVIASLKHDLGNNAFRKLNTWVDLNYVAETSVPAPEMRPSQPPAMHPSTEHELAIDV